jgi:hypothetical protein
VIVDGRLLPWYDFPAVTSAVLEPRFLFHALMYHCRVLDRQVSVTLEMVERIKEEYEARGPFGQPKPVVCACLPHCLFLNLSPKDRMLCALARALEVVWIH